MPTYTWTIPANACEVPRIRSAVTSFVVAQQVGNPPLADVALAVSEAVTNAVVHGFSNGRRGHVDVTVTVDWARREMHIIVTDNGTGMVPRPDSPGLGLGLPLIATVADGLEIGTPESGLGTELSIMFSLPGALD